MGAGRGVALSGAFLVLVQASNVTVGARDLGKQRRVHFDSDLIKGSVSWMLE